MTVMMMMNHCDGDCVVMMVMMMMNHCECDCVRMVLMMMMMWCLQAVEDYGALRLGHGYRCQEDEALYQRVLEIGIHFETCPLSSIITKGAPTGKVNHPIIRYTELSVGCSNQ